MKILENTQDCLKILEMFGFSFTSNKHLLSYNLLKRNRVTSDEIVPMFAANNFSDKLFDIACRKLFLNKCSMKARIFPKVNKYFSVDSLIKHNSNNKNGTNTKRGVYCFGDVDDDCNPTSSYTLSNGLCIDNYWNTNGWISLINELLLLPNHHHCFCLRMRWKKHNFQLYILNNNGTYYKNIDWNRITIDQLQDNLTPADISIASYYIEYCKSNNLNLYLKKILYFMAKFEIKTVIPCL